MSDAPAGEDADASGTAGEAPAFEWLAPGAGESVVWSAHPRLMTVLPAALVGLALVVAGVAAAVVAGRPLALALVPVGLAVPAWKYLVVTHTRFVVTDRALYRKRGVFSRSVRRVGIERVQNSAFRQGMRGSLFGYGTVVVEAAGGGRLRFHDIEDPREVRALVDRRAGGGDGIPGSTAQWEAVLAEVRALRGTLGVEPPE